MFLPSRQSSVFEPTERVVILDASEPVHLEGRLVSEQVIEVIDHRKVNEAYRFTNAKIQIELVGGRRDVGCRSSGTGDKTKCGVSADSPSGDYF